MSAVMASAQHDALAHHPSARPAWPSSILPATLQTHGLRCNDLTPTLARRLVGEGQLTAEDFIETSPAIERTLMEAFLEDDYEGRLHLTTLSMKSAVNKAGDVSGGVENEEEIVGMSFWREVPSDEMKDWMDMRRISKAIRDKRLAAPQSPGSDEEHGNLSHDARKRMRLVKSDSAKWIESALQPCNANNTTSHASDMSGGNAAPSQSTMHKLTHSWIKIELIAIKRTHRAHHLGHLLLGCTLARAHALHHNEHAILHIAGGGASKNVPAGRLYARFGFVAIPRHDEGGPFVKPDRDLFVLGNIGRALGALPWEEVLQIGSEGDSDEEIVQSKDDCHDAGEPSRV
ncbi:hypothetical protein ACHAXT_008906 [Thalassiosira profunda]